VLVEPQGPLELATSAGGATTVREHIRAALAALGDGAPAYREQSYLLVRRGPYVIAAAPADEKDGVAGSPLRLEGRYLDLFDGDLPVRTEVVLPPGGCIFLLDLDRVTGGPFQGTAPGTASGATVREGQQPCVLAAAGRVEEERLSDRGLTFRLSGPAGTTAVCRVRLPGAPSRALAAGTAIQVQWDAPTGTALLRHPNDPGGVVYEISW
jgi:hypothetical protein